MERGLSRRRIPQIGGRLMEPEVEGAVAGPNDFVSEQKLRRLNLNPQDGTAGFEKVLFDLKQFPWPIHSDSVDEIRCMDYMQKLDGTEQIKFMNELHRILKSKSGALIGTPYGNSNRAWQNPSNKRPIYGETYLYYNKGFRESNQLFLPEITADFDISFPYQALDDSLKTRHHEVQGWMSKHFVNAIHDLIALVVKR
jgi:hypothetical protein